MGKRGVDKKWERDQERREYEDAERKRLNTPEPPQDNPYKDFGDVVPSKPYDPSDDWGPGD